MVWIEARFQIAQDGKYARAWLNFNTSDWTKAVSRFKSFGQGYEIGTGGFKCSLEQLETCGATAESYRKQFKIPQEMDKLTLFLNVIHP